MVAAMHCPTCKLAALVLGLATLLPCSASLGAPLDLGSGFDAGNAAPGTGQTAPFLQCVPYARQVTGIQLFGDAHTWWDQAAVSRVIDSRTVLLRHANWSPINGRRGQIENGVRAIDVSPDNDWSEVRVWFAPLQALGTTRWPINGFIYPQKARGELDDGVIAAKVRRPAPRVVNPQLDADQIIVEQGPADDFTATFAAYTPRVKARPLAARAPVGATRSRIGADFLAGITNDAPARAKARPVVTYAARTDDPIGRIIAARMR